MEPHPEFVLFMLETNRERGEFGHIARVPYDSSFESLSTWAKIVVPVREMPVEVIRTFNTTVLSATDGKEHPCLNISVRKI